MPTPAPRTALRHALGWLGWWVALFALWTALIDAVTSTDLAVGAACAAIGATAARLVDALGLVALRVRPRWLIGLWRPVWQVGPDCVALTVAVARRLAGRSVHGALAELSFHDGPDAEARSVMIKVAGSLAPGSYVVRIDAAEERMIVHTLPASDDPARMADPLGLA
jgi:multisubunit Na+/H+ antiporter MnhE subunit